MASYPKEEQPTNYGVLKYELDYYLEGILKSFLEEWGF